MKKALFLLFLICNTIAIAQDSIRITGHLKNNTRFAKVVVQQYAVGKINVNVASIEKEKFTITAPASIPAGVYRLQYSQSSLYDYVTVIINGKEKEIAFSVDVLHPERPVNFTASEENKKWYAYKKEQNIQLQNIEVLNQLLTNYTPKTAKIIKQTQKALVKAQKKYTQHQQNFVNTNAHTWAAAMVENRPQYFTNALAPVEVQEQNRKLHFWDNINTTNPKLINTPLYTEHILNYLQDYINPQKEMTEQERNKGLIASINTIMKKFSGNEFTEKFALQYLQLGFKEIGNEEVLQYLDENYQHILAQCNDDALDKTAFEKRMEGYATMKVGNKAPNIVFEHTNSTLYDIVSNTTLVVFWASWCPHCMEEMPKVNAWAKENPNTKVVAISLDEDKTAYEEALKSLPNLFHYSDLKKWNGKAVNDYYIYGTPSFIVLDKDKKIVGKYTSFKAIEK